MRSAGAAAVAVAAVIWGSWKLWFPPGATLDAAAQGALVLTVAGLLSTVHALSSRRVVASARAWGLLAVFALGDAANYLFYFHALAAGDSAAAAATHYLAPVLVAVASPLVREPMGRRAMVSAPVAFLATIVLVGAGSGSGATKTAALLGTASAVFYAANILISKRLSGVFTPVELVGFHSLAAAPIVWSFSSTPPWHAPAGELALGLTGAVLGGTFAAALYFWGLARIAAARAAVLSYVEPLGATLVGVLVLGEPLAGAQLVAVGVIVLAGAAVALEREPSGAGVRAAS